eukprot:g532.t1
MEEDASFWSSQRAAAPRMDRTVARNRLAEKAKQEAGLSRKRTFESFQRREREEHANLLAQEDEKDSLAVANSVKYSEVALAREGLCAEVVVAVLAPAVSVSMIHDAHELLEEVRAMILLISDIFGKSTIDACIEASLKREKTYRVMDLRAEASKICSATGIFLDNDVFIGNDKLLVVYDDGLRKTCFFSCIGTKRKRKEPREFSHLFCIADSAAMPELERMILFFKVLLQKRNPNMVTPEQCMEDFARLDLSTRPVRGQHALRPLDSLSERIFENFVAWVLFAKGKKMKEKNGSIQGYSACIQLLVFAQNLRSALKPALQSQAWLQAHIAETLVLVQRLGRVMFDSGVCPYRQKIEACLVQILEVVRDALVNYRKFFPTYRGANSALKDLLAMYRASIGLLKMFQGISNDSLVLETELSLKKDLESGWEQQCLESYETMKIGNESLAKTFDDIHARLKSDHDIYDSLLSFSSLCLVQVNAQSFWKRAVEDLRAAVSSEVTLEFELAKSAMRVASLPWIKATETVDEIFADEFDRWIESSFARYSEIVGRLIEEDDFRPLGDDCMWSSSSQGLIYLLQQTVDLLPQLPGHSRAGNTARFSKRLVCDILCLYARSIKAAFDVEEILTVRCIMLNNVFHCRSDLQMLLEELEIASATVHEIEVTLIRARGIPKLDFGGLMPSDPYAVLELHDGMIRKKHHSSVQRNTVSPVWNESFALVAVGDPTLTVKMYDFDIDGADDVIGDVSIKNIATAEHAGLPVWYSLHVPGKLKKNAEYRGEVCIAISVSSKLQLGSHTMRTLDAQLDNLLGCILSTDEIGNLLRSMSLQGLKEYLRGIIETFCSSLDPSVFARVLVGIWRVMMDIMLGMLLPTLSASTPLSALAKDFNRQKNAWWKRRNSMSSVEYMAKEEASRLLEIHSELANFLYAEGSEFGLPPSVAERELGGDLIYLVKLYTVDDEEGIEMACAKISCEMIVAREDGKNNHKEKLCGHLLLYFAAQGSDAAKRLLCSDIFSL